jgi:hypothetical protein
MEMRTVLFVMLNAAVACGGAQAAGQAPAELQPGYPGYPASSSPVVPVPPPTVQEIPASPGMSPGEVSGASSGASSASGDPAPAPSSGSPDLNAPRLEARPSAIMPTKPLSPPAPMTGVEPVRENGITFLCGGIGLDESDRMKREARNYDLALTFAARDGSYLADINVDIADARGQSLLKTSCGAPMLLVDLPKSGNYRISAETGGHTVTRTLQVRDTQPGKAVTMIWPSQGPEKPMR